MRGVRAAVVVVISAVVAGTGCSPADAGSRVERETLANGATRLFYPALGTGAPVTMVGGLRIGALEGEGPEVFGQVKSIAVDRDGEIYVLDAQALEVRVFDGAGAHLRTLGRPGEGPGEISEANGIALSGDTLLWVQDHGKWHFLGLDPETGEELTRIPMHALRYGYVWNGGTDRAGRLWKATSHSDQERTYPPETGMTEWTNRAYWSWLDPATGASDSIFIGERSGRTFVAEIGGGYRYSGVPFEAQAQAAIDPFEGFWLTDSDPYRITHVDLNGDTTLVIEADVQGPLVLDEELQRFRDAAEERGERDLQIAVDMEAFVPDRKAPIGGLHTDDEGRLWVERTGASASGPLTFDVFDRSGDYLGTVQLAFSTMPYIPPTIRNGYFHAIEQNELEVPVVVRAEVPGLGG